MRVKPLQLFQRRRQQTARLTTGTLLTSLCVGAVGGVAGGAARMFFRAAQWLATGSFSPSPPDAAAPLSPWHRALVPLCGGLLACGVAALVARLRTRFGTAANRDYNAAVQEGDGVIPLPASLGRMLIAGTSIGTGATIGREGAMIQFAAAIAGSAARRFVSPAFPLARQVACGVAAGVAAAYQAPLAAIFFAAEIVLPGIAWGELVLLAVAAYSGLYASRLMLDAGPLFAAPMHLPLAQLHWWWALAVAALMGVAGPAYQVLIRSMLFARRWPLALLWSGAAVGLLSLATPLVWGNGDVALKHLVGVAPGHIASAGSVAKVFALRTVALVLCVGTGTVGGVFTPTLFTGATLGALLAHSALLAHGGFGPSAPATLLMELTGMAALIGAVTHAPIMASLMVVELTGRWEAFPLLLACCLLSSTIAATLSGRSLYGIASEHPGHHPGMAPNHDAVSPIDSGNPTAIPKPSAS